MKIALFKLIRYSLYLLTPEDSRETEIGTSIHHETEKRGLFVAISKVIFWVAATAGFYFCVSRLR